MRFSISSVLVLWFLCNYCLNYTKNEGNYWSTKFISRPPGKHTEVDIQSHSYSHLWPISNQQPSPIPMFLNYGNRERPHRHGENTQRLDSNLGPGDVANSTTVNGLNLWERNLPKQFFGCSLFIPAQQILEVPQLWRDSPLTCYNCQTRVTTNKYVTDRHTKPVDVLPWLPWAPWGSEWVRLGSSLPWLPSSQGQTSTLFHLRSWRSHDDFCSGLQWGFSTMHIHRAPGHTHTNTHFSYLPYFSVCNSDVSNESYKSHKVCLLRFKIPLIQISCEIESSGLFLHPNTVSCSFRSTFYVLPPSCTGIQNSVKTENLTSPEATLTAHTSF